MLQVHNNVQIHSIVFWDWQYFVEDFIILTEFGECFVEYCQSHVTLL